MDVPERIRLAAQRLKEGHRINRITVRDFLRHFGVERRRDGRVQKIRTILNGLDLETDPDFATEWIDAPIWLRLKPGFATPQMPNGNTEVEEMVLESTPSAVKQAEEQSETAPTSMEPEASKVGDHSNTAIFDDPTFRIGRLPAANKKLIVVNQQDSLTKAITLMLEHDFSQLPVMQGEREVKGVVTWKSVASKQALGFHCETVKECREDARIVDSNRTLFDAIPTIVERGYVLVRNEHDRRITGIVTASDLSLQFQSLAEPFLFLREIELHVRQLLGNKMTNYDFELLDAAPPAAAKSKPQDINDLTLGQYVRLFQHPQIWAKLELKIDATVLTALLEEVRLIRNDVMHFEPDPLTQGELNTLKRAVGFMQELSSAMRKIQ